MKSPALNWMKDRDPLLPRSQISGRRLFEGPGRLRYHTDLRGNRVVYCGCGPFIRGQLHAHSDLARNRRKDRRWASDFRFAKKYRASTATRIK